MKKQKLHKCRECKEGFVRVRPLQVICTRLECAIAAADRARKKKELTEQKAKRTERKEVKSLLEPMPKKLARAQKWVNEYIRERDEDEPCISCGRWDVLEWHAGHFIPVGRAKSIRFDYANIHKQCGQCNTHFNGNATRYEEELRRRIGDQEVERLKTARKDHKWTREEVEAIEADAKRLLKELRSQFGQKPHAHA